MTNNSLVSYAPRNFQELEAFCGRIVKSGMVPAAYRDKPDAALVAIMHGHEHGVSPLASLQYIAVVNGKPAFYSDALPGIALGKGYISDLDCDWSGTEYEDGFTCICTVTKANGKTLSRSFSVADARKAGLWGKQGTWQQYPKRMLMWRAIGYAVRDAAPHALLGYTAEELRDIPSEPKHVGPEKARDITPAPTPHQEAEKAQQQSDEVQFLELFDEYGEYIEAHDNPRDWLIAYGKQKKEAGANAPFVARANFNLLRVLAVAAKNGNKAKIDRDIQDANAVTGDPVPPTELGLDDLGHDEPALPMQEGGL